MAVNLLICFVLLIVDSSFFAAYRPERKRIGEEGSHYADFLSRCRWSEQKMPPSHDGMLMQNMMEPVHLGHEATRDNKEVTLQLYSTLAALWIDSEAFNLCE